MWQQLGTGSRKSGLRRSAEQPGDCMLGGWRLRLVLGSFKTFAGHIVEVEPHECVSHLPLSESCSVRHLAVVSLELLIAGLGGETKQCVCLRYKSQN